MLLGRELGLPVMAALRSVHIIEGKHSLSAELMVALGTQERAGRVFPGGRDYRQNLHV